MPKPSLKKDSSRTIKPIAWVGDKKIHWFLLGIILKVNLMVWLEIELTYSDVRVQHVSHNATETPPLWPPYSPGRNKGFINFQKMFIRKCTGWSISVDCKKNEKNQWLSNGDWRQRLSSNSHRCTTGHHKEARKTFLKKHKRERERGGERDRGREGGEGEIKSKRTKKERNWRWDIKDMSSKLQEVLSPKQIFKNVVPSCFQSKKKISHVFPSKPARAHTHTHTHTHTQTHTHTHTHWK